MLSSSAVGHCDIAIMGWEIPIINGGVSAKIRWQKVRLSRGLYDYKMIRLLYDLYDTHPALWDIIRWWLFYDYDMVMIIFWAFPAMIWCHPSGRFRRRFREALPGFRRRRLRRGFGGLGRWTHRRPAGSHWSRPRLKLWSCGGEVWILFLVYIYIWYLCVCMSFAKD